jgi:hypothetical protein
VAFVKMLHVTVSFINTNVSFSKRKGKEKKAGKQLLIWIWGARGRNDRWMLCGKQIHPILDP